MADPATPSPAAPAAAASPAAEPATPAPASPPAAPAAETTTETPAAETTTATPAAAAAAAPAPANTGILEADDVVEAEDDDSALGTPGDASETTSMASFIYRYREQHGRTYHAYKADGEYKSYWLPNDDRENERLDLQHTLFMLTQDNQLFTCPAVKDKPLRRVLDAGCGTGIWSIDFADDHPETSVVGVDLSPIQPTFVPPNVEFFVDDLEADWNFVNDFDFIYARFMTGSIKDWPRFFSQAFSHMYPGGHIEVCDILSPLHCDDGSLPDDCDAQKWNVLLLETSLKIGVGIDSARRYEQQMTEAGFENVVKVEYKWPMNSWPKDKKHKEMGIWSNMNMTAALQALTLMLFTKVLGWSVAEVEVLLAGVRKDFKNKEYHAYWPIWVVYGQKPE